MPVIGIDIGTQSLKAVVVDSISCRAARRAFAYRPNFPAPGWAEQDPGLWLKALKPGIAAALSKSGLSPADIKGDSGIRAARRLFTCRRQWAGACALHHLDGPARHSRGCRNRPRADPSPYGPGARRDAYGGKDRAGCASTCPRHATPRSGTSPSPSSWRRSAAVPSWITRSPLRPCSTAWKSAAMPATCSTCSSVDRTELPEIDDATAAAGALSRAGANLTGLRAGTPVAVGTGDDFANPIGAGVVEPGAVACNLGTAEVVGAVSDSLRDRRRKPGRDAWFPRRPFPGQQSGLAFGRRGDMVPVDLRRLDCGRTLRARWPGTAWLRRTDLSTCAFRRDDAALGGRRAWGLLWADCFARQSRLRARPARRMRLRHARRR